MSHREESGPNWEWEGKKLSCKIRRENGNPAADNLKEVFEKLLKFSSNEVNDLINEFKQSKKHGSKVPIDRESDKAFKQLVGRSRIIGASKIAIEEINAYDEAKAATVTQKNLKKMYAVLPKSPPRRVLLEIQRESAKPEQRLPSNEHKTNAEKLEKRLAKQKALRIAASEKLGKEDDAKKAAALEEVHEINLEHARHVLHPYHGDLFSSTGDNMEGMLYLSRMANSSVRTKRSAAGLFDADGKPSDEAHAQSDRDATLRGEKDGLNADDEHSLAESSFNSPDMSVKLNCAMSLCNWSRNPANAQRLASEGAVKAIMLLAPEKSHKITRYCAAAFRFMSEYPVLAAQMIDDGAIKTIADLVNSTSDDFIAHNLAIALVNVTRINGKESQVVESAVIFNALVHLITYKPELGSTCVRAVYNLTCIDAPYPSIERVIRSLISLVSLSAAGTVTSKVKHICAAALCNLSDLKPIRTRMVEEGTIGSLAALSKGAETRTRRICAVILQNLSSTTSTGKVEMASRGSVNVAYSLSSDQDPIILRCVGLTLSRLASETSNCQRITNDAGIAALCNIAVKYPTIPGITQPVAAAFQLLSVNQSQRAAIVKDGSITAIASLLRSSVDMFTLQHSLLALCNFICEPENHAPIFQMGLVATLVAMCSNENDLLRDLCSLAFLNLSRTEDSRKQLVNAGAVGAIISVSQQNSVNTKRRCAATLCNLSYHSGGMAKMVSDGIIPCIVDLVLAKDIKTVHYSCAALCRMCSAAVENARLILDSGAVPNLVRGAVEGDTMTKQFCGAVLSALSFYEYCRLPLSEFGAIEALKGLANLTDAITRQRCLVAFANLSCDVSIHLKMINEGVVSIIAELAYSNEENNYSACAKAICNLACCEGKKLIVAREGGVLAVLMISMVKSVDRTTKVLCVLGLNNLLDESTVQFMVNEGIVGSVAKLSRIDDGTQKHTTSNNTATGNNNTMTSTTTAANISSSKSNESRDPKIESWSARIFNHLSKFSVARAKMCEKVSHLRALIRLIDSPVRDTSLIAMRTCCNLALDAEHRDLSLFVSSGMLSALGRGLKLEDRDTVSQCVAALFSLSNDPLWLEALPLTLPYANKDSDTSNYNTQQTIPSALLALMDSPRITANDSEKCAQVLTLCAHELKSRVHMQKPSFIGELCAFIARQTQVTPSLQWLISALRYSSLDMTDMQRLMPQLAAVGMIDALIAAHRAIVQSQQAVQHVDAAVIVAIYADLIDILRSLSDISDLIPSLATQPVVDMLCAAVSAQYAALPTATGAKNKALEHHWSLYHAAVIVLRWSGYTNNNNVRAMSSTNETCQIIELVAHCTRAVDLVVLALGNYLSDQRSRAAFLTQTTATTLAMLSKRSLSENTQSNLIQSVYAMSKLSSTKDFLLTAQLDKFLTSLFAHENKRIRDNVNKAYKNINSDLNEAIEEGAVAMLISQSFDAGGKRMTTDEFFPASILPHHEQKQEVPSCKALVLTAEEDLSKLRWFAKVAVVRGGAAGKGPEAPDPPQISSDSSTAYPNMIEELDGNEMDGKTKMAFAKMQVPSAMRETFVLGDGDFLTNRERDEAAALAALANEDGTDGVENGNQEDEQLEQQLMIDADQQQGGDDNTYNGSVLSAGGSLTGFYMNTDGGPLSRSALRSDKNGSADDSGSVHSGGHGNNSHKSRRHHRDGSPDRTKKGTGGGQGRQQLAPLKDHAGQAAKMGLFA